MVLMFLKLCAIFLETPNSTFRRNANRALFYSQ